MSNISKRRREGSRAKIKSMGDHKEFLKRITKTLYYGQLPSLPCLSLPVTEISCEAWSVWQRGRSVRRLHVDAAASIARHACVSPAALVLALLYLERLRASRLDYLTATPPADLFLVTLMVSNKFLQDDGEDEEVICSEWAASGGMGLDQLKKLEIEFLNAIDWNIFVNEKSFEEGLQRLERRVALKQAQLHGFFTYTDLAGACDPALAGELLRSLAAATLAALATLATLAAAGGLLAWLLLAHAALPAARRPAPAPARPTALDANIITHSFRPPLISMPNIPNSTADSLGEETLVDEPEATPTRCCAKWLRYRENASERTGPRYDDMVVRDWKSFEPWSSKTSVLNWLYRSSLVNPLRRWLDRIKEYADLFTRELNEESTESTERCQDYEKAIKYTDSQKCVRQWLNLSKLSALVVSMSDR